MKIAGLILVLSVAAAAQKAVPPKPYPEYMTGDECLFCHRAVGNTWQDNSHANTVRPKESMPNLEKVLRSPAVLAPFLPEMTHYLGGRNVVRFLKQDGYGKMDLLSLKVLLGKTLEVSNIGASRPAWDKTAFQERCNGCHMTAVDSVTRQYAAIGHECFVCHGMTPGEHTNDQKTVLLSKDRLKAGTDSARVLVSLCAQCHLRGGKSKTTGLPYAYNFVAGEDLFKDYDVNFMNATDIKLNPGDRHVYRNTADVILNGKTKVTCVNCHQVHAQPSARKIEHYTSRKLDQPICLDCHSNEGKYTPGYIVHSAICEY